MKSIARNCGLHLNLVLGLTILTSFLLPAHADPAPGRTTIDLSGPGWKLWRDKDGTWRKDYLYIHHEASDTYKRNDDAEINQPDKPGKWKLADISTASPTGGWAALDSKSEADVTVPGTVEQYLWGKDGGATDGNKGDYIGVSWWWRTITVPADVAGKKVFLDFESVNRRAEIFLDGRLVGYDCIGNTPFSVDITNFVKPGQSRQLAVRITKPGGYMGWTDNPMLIWGSMNWQSGGKQATWGTDPKYRDAGITVNQSRGFGGILGTVKLQMVDPIRIGDLWMRNKPTITDADATVEVANDTGREEHGTFHLDVTDKKTGQAVFAVDKTGVTLPPGTSQVVVSAHVPEAKPWNLSDPNLYEGRVKLTGDNGAFADEASRTFGFRWFDVRGIGTDASYRLNDKRIVLLSAISWGFWPITGIVPSPEMAAKQVQMAKRIGLNMLNFHRAIGQRIVLDQADQQGLLYLEEPGGYEGYWSDDFGYANNREKLLRLVKRDRSHPSLAIYNLTNESEVHCGPVEVQKRDMVDAHKLDPTRVETWTSGGNVGEPGKPYPGRPWMKPLDMTVHTCGQYDNHESHSADVYLDKMYQSPEAFLKRAPHETPKPPFSYGDKDAGELIFWGEEGAMGAPPRLQLIHDFHQQPGQLEGWDGDFFEVLYKGYTQSLKDLGLDKFYTVDSLSQALGDKQFYYHGRIIENIKINDVTDGYVINGWENDKDSSQDGLVDLYRNPKTENTHLISNYCRPLYVAVKLRHKIAQTGETAVCDFYVINEVDLKGGAMLKVSLVSPSGKVSSEQSFPVNVKGGDIYGQLLTPGIKFPLSQETGTYIVRAELSQNSETKAKGSDEIYVVDWKSDVLPKQGQILDSSGEIKQFLSEKKGLKLPAWGKTNDKPQYVIVGEGDFLPIADTRTKILDQVQNDGLIAIVVDRTQSRDWAQALSDRKRINFGGQVGIQYAWLGGSYFSGESPLLTGLPQKGLLNWQYQLMANRPVQNFDFGLLDHEPKPPYDNAWGLRIGGDNITHVIAAQNDIDPSFSTGLCIIPYGKGRVVLCCLDLLPYLNASFHEAETVRKLFCNLIQYGTKPVGATH